MANVIVTYNGQQIEPAPFFTINKVYNENPDGIAVGSVFNLTLENRIVNIASGLGGVMADEVELRDIFSDHGKLLKIECDGSIIFQCYPRILAVDFTPTNDNWTQTAQYSIQLQYNLEVGNDEDSGLHPPFIQSSTETWTVEFVQDSHWYSFDNNNDIAPYQLIVTHTVGAVGLPHYNAGTLVKPAHEYAIDYVKPKLGYQHHKVVSTGVLNLNSTLSEWVQRNHFRTVNIDERGGAYNVTETWAILDTGVASLGIAAVEDFNVEARINREEENNTVTVNGTIIGLENRTYGNNPGDFDITQSKYAAASNYWDSVADSIRIFPRAQAIGSAETILLNSIPVTKIVTHSPAQGQISYSYTYNDQPANCLTGVKFESIVVTDNNPTDIFSQITVLGRPQGPILQNLNTVSTFTREVAIEAVADSDPGDCPQNSISEYLSWGNDIEGQVNSILCKFEEDIENTYTTYFKHLDTKSFDPKRGRYTRNVGWTAQNCSTAPNTEIC